MVHLLKKIELGFLVSDMSNVWEDTDGCSNQYRRAIVVYFMNVLYSLYGTIMVLAINATGNGNNGVDILSATDNRYFK